MPCLSKAKHLAKIVPIAAAVAATAQTLTLHLGSPRCSKPDKEDDSLPGRGLRD